MYGFPRYNLLPNTLDGSTVSGTMLSCSCLEIIACLLAVDGKQADLATVSCFSHDVMIIASGTFVFCLATVDFLKLIHCFTNEDRCGFSVG